MPEQVVKTVFKGKDKVSKSFKKMGKSADKFGRRADKAFKKASKSALSFKTITAGILGAGAIQLGLSTLRNGVRQLGEEIVSFDDSITRAAAKFPEKIKRGTKEFKALEKVSRRVGATTKFTATEAAQGLDFLAMAGFNATQAMAALPQVTDLAVVGGMDLARSTDIASDALGAFNLMSKDSAVLTKNLSRINDVFAKTVVTANTDLEMLYEAMKDGAPVATQAGASVETFNTLVGKLANAGIKGSKAGTTLKNMFLRISAPAKDAQRIFKKYDITTQDSSGNMLDMVNIIGQLNKAFGGLGTAQKSAALDTIFSKRAIAGASVLMAEGEESLKKYRSQLEAAGGAAREMAGDIGQSLGNKLLTLKSALIETGFRVMDNFKGKFPAAIDAAISAVRKFDVEPIVKALKSTFKWIKNTYFFIKDKLIPLAFKLKPLLFGIAAAFIAVKASMAVIAFKSFISGFALMVPAAKGASTAIGLLNVVMRANPIMAIATAAGLAVTAIVLLVNKLDTVKRYLVDIGILSDKERRKSLRDKKQVLKDLDEAPLKEKPVPEGKRLKTAIEFAGEKPLGEKKKFELGRGLGTESQRRLEAKRIVDEEFKRSGKKFSSAIAAKSARAMAEQKAFKGLEARAEAKKGFDILKGLKSEKFIKPVVERTLAQRELATPEFSTRKSMREPPNKAKEDSKEVNIKGRIDLAGAPKGSTFKIESKEAPLLEAGPLGQGI